MNYRLHVPNGHHFEQCIFLELKIEIQRFGKKILGRRNLTSQVKPQIFAPM